MTEFSTAGSCVGGIAVRDHDVFVFTFKRELIQFSLKKNKIFKKINAVSLGGNIVGMTSAELDGRDLVLITAHFEGKCVVWDFDYDAPVKIFNVARDHRLSCICLSGPNKVTLGTMSGGVASLCIDDTPEEKEPIVPKSIEISSKPIVSICADPNEARTVLVNSCGLVIIL